VEAHAGDDVEQVTDVADAGTDLRRLDFADLAGRTLHRLGDLLHRQAAVAPVPA
jgi:hypothetical protein